MASDPPARPLQDVTVLDMTSALAGPFCSLLLAGLGARVIKIEAPGRGDGNRDQPPYLGRDGVSLTRRHDDDMSVGFMNRSRSKQSVTLDLKHPDAAAIFADLVRVSDVVLENFSPGTAGRLGVDYDVVRTINPRAVYCSISGFGSAGGPGRDRAYDTIVQALSGLMMTSGETGGPPVKIGIPIADLAAPLYGTIGVLAALNQARWSGEGQHVDVSMLGTLTSIVSCEPFSVLEECGIPTRTGETVPRLSPFGIYQAADAYVAICAGNDKLFALLAGAMGLQDLASDPRFTTRDARAGNWRAIDVVVGEWVGRHTVASVVETLSTAGVPVAPVREPSEAAHDPEVIARGETEPLRHPTYPEARPNLRGPGVPIVFSGAESSLSNPAPLLGEHNHPVYGGLLGYSAERIAALVESGAITRSVRDGEARV